MNIFVRGYLTLAAIIPPGHMALEEGTSLRGLLELMASRGGQEFAASVFDPEHGLRAGVAVLVNGRSTAHAEAGLELPLEDGDEVAIFPALAGG